MGVDEPSRPREWKMGKEKGQGQRRERERQRELMRGDRERGFYSSEIKWG
jgi:hypothetical protein